ncbi:MAG: lysylphosphatidylglycerol synthase domain-containing protein [Patescibacteria group bacterium]
MNELMKLFQNKWVRLVLIVLIVGATLVVFTKYLIDNPDIIGLIFSMHPAAIALLALAYVGTIVANAFVLSASLRMIGKRVGFVENVSLTGYSSVVNFFGPLQSGPGFRAAYLKQRHDVSLRKFLYATLVFYGFFAVINGLVILAALLARAPAGRVIPLAVSTLLIVVSASFLAYRFIPKLRDVTKNIKVTSLHFWAIGIGALALSLCTAAAYFVELLHVDVTITFLQTIVYAAAANLALFVSLTPGAIGFRESFLLLTQQLHQIPTDTVIAASIIDRAFYVLFLLALFLFLLAIGVRTKLRSSNRR